MHARTHAARVNPRARAPGIDLSRARTAVKIFLELFHVERLAHKDSVVHTMAMSNAYRDKLLSISISPQATPSRQLRNYYDSQSVAEVFGPDSEEQYMEETDGKGAAKRGADGVFYHRSSYTGDVEPIDPAHYTESGDDLD